MSNMTFPCVNTIQLGPSPFKSSPQCKNALYVIISGLIPENLIHISGCAPFPGATSPGGIFWPKSEFSNTPKMAENHKF